MDEDGKGPKTKYRKIKHVLLNFTPSLPPTLPNLCPCSRASCLPQLVVVLPLVLCHLPSGVTSICPPLIKPLPLIMPLFFSGALTSHLPWLFGVSCLVMPPPLVRLCLHLSLHCCLLLRPSCNSCPAGCHVASHYNNASCPPVPPTLIAPLPLLRPSCASCPLWLVVM
jgi:hypothetical protein